MIKQHPNPLNLVIIGGGFCGALTAIHLLKEQDVSINIHLVHKGSAIGKGVAYDPYHSSLLLNVPNGRMSAFAEIPEHYTDWLKRNGDDCNEEPADLSAQFSTRREYGNYINALWLDALQQIPSSKSVKIYDAYAMQVCEAEHGFEVHLSGTSSLSADVVILATGNQLPGIPNGIDTALQQSKYYFGNPWDEACITEFKEDEDLLIIGNGLTMADTVLTLVDAGFKATIHTVSPRGYQLKPSKEDKEPYLSLDIPSLLKDKDNLLTLLNAFNKHRKIADGLSQSIYQGIDAVRPHAQKIWNSFDDQEKQQFIKRINSVWSSSRHRLPLQTYFTLEKYQHHKKLITHKGFIVNTKEEAGVVTATLNCNGKTEQLNVQRIINCTGPNTDIKKQSGTLLFNMEKAGLICRGPHHIGIKTSADDHCVISADGNVKENLFVIGSNLKGSLWESTAVPELRLQAQKLAERILSSLIS
ncbi:FAD/NAD(P)-binding protein [Pedobacter sp. MC2016-14]|uniref:FAD/NAD(P)-binding protein n=1 Tax=Pedobacter sp. MC2016-14 TaxID=2897327 RepID=UPI001E3931F5|nr:FAD/NAD(P)-binding protein [Pedobacter sp. MC2016-14]MCD0488799.1 FAD/NAD(P)-binding protein [Pedobacter sp. MC2016-14]